MLFNCSLVIADICKVFSVVTSSIAVMNNEHDGISNHRPIDCLLSHLFSCRSKKRSKLHVTGFVRGIHLWLVNSPHKGPVMWKMLPFDDIIMIMVIGLCSTLVWVPDTLQWRHNKHDGISSHQRLDYLLNHLFRDWSKKTSNFRSLAFVPGIDQWPVNTPHKGPVTQKMFPFVDVIMTILCSEWQLATSISELSLQLIFTQMKLNCDKPMTKNMG